MLRSSSAVQKTTVIMSFNTFNVAFQDHHLVFIAERMVEATVHSWEDRRRNTWRPDDFWKPSVTTSNGNISAMELLARISSNSRCDIA